MAQNFHAAFGLDQTDKSVNTVDMDGVVPAGVKCSIFAVRRWEYASKRRPRASTRSSTRLPPRRSAMTGSSSGCGI